MKINEYLEQAKAKLNVSSDSKLSNEIGVNRQTISHWRQGKNSPDEFACFQIANILMIDPRKVIADTRYDVEKDIDRKEFWEETKREYGFISISYALFYAFCSISIMSILYILCKIADVFPLVRFFNNNEPFVYN